MVQKNTHQAPINVPQSMIPIIPYTDDELDAEWAQYCLVLNKTNHLIMKKNQEKKRIKKHEKEIMISLEKHVRKLSETVRFELEHTALDCFGDISDDISSDSNHSETSIDSVISNKKCDNKESFGSDPKENALIETIKTCKLDKIQKQKSSLTTKNNYKYRKKKKKSKKHRKNRKWIEPIPSKSKIELEIEQAIFEENRQKYIANMVHEMFDENEYGADDDDDDDNNNNNNDNDDDETTEIVIPLDTEKIFKDINQEKHSLFTDNKPSEICLY